ncbi:zinc finger CCCH domain-containing protein 3 isoform X4 [Carica papaya]|uniref:zinc finger CCCH domain-containing protein 3 isoform X4 n=1 Tax=Carica papaya TaxID=3649 RepID=UPI000B8CF98D|nr:zinc finger CCCH domain-containing protein 3 isoform X4 [Carica papaya]
MPLGKYYCDYCDKEFQDTPAARKRHLQGTHHLRAKALWYNMLQGFCPYGYSCRYRHPNKNLPTPANSQGFTDMNLRSQIMPSNQLVGGSSLQGNVVRDSMGMSWDNLPPSLKPPPEGGYPPLPFIDWG